MRKAFKLKASIAAFAMAFGVVMMGAVQADQPAAAATYCPPVVLIGIHGTNEETDVIGATLQGLYIQVTAHTGLPKQGLTGWSDDSTLLTDLAAGFATGNLQTALSNLATAIDTGVTLLGKQLTADEASCPGQHFILAGFSQGAMVIHDWITQNPSVDNNVSGVILFADPLFNGNDPSSYGAADGSSTFTSTSGWQGIAGSATFPSVWSGKVFSYCISDDPICDSQNYATDALELHNHGDENKTPAIMTASETLIDGEGVGWAPGAYDDSAATFYTTWQNNGGVSGWLGAPRAQVVSEPGGGLLQSFAGSNCGSYSAILWSASTGTHAMGDCIYNAFLNTWGGPGGTYGYPTSDQKSTMGGTGEVSYMSGTACSSTETGSGLFYSSATGVWPVHGCIFQKYQSIKEDESGIGLPTSNEYSITGGVEQNFSNGYIRDAGGSITDTVYDDNGLDNTDPYATGCVSSAYPKSTVYKVYDGPTEIDLEWSAHCGTNWTQVTPNTGNGNGAIEMLIWVERENANGSMTVGESFEFPPDGSTIAWSNQLYAPTQPAMACEQYWVRATKTWSSTVCTPLSATT